MELPELTSINNHTINLIKNNQTLSGPVYKLDRAKNFEDVHQNLANRFIWIPKS